MPDPENAKNELYKSLNKSIKYYGDYLKALERIITLTEESRK